jgi:Zn-dependent protease
MLDHMASATTLGSGSSSNCNAHTEADAALRCGRCEAWICGKCMVASMVGTRCRKCAPVVEKRASAAGASSILGMQATGRGRVALMGLITATVAAVLVYAWLNSDHDRFIVRTIVFGGFLASTVLHELAHGMVAFWGGDKTVKTRGFLTLNPLKYLDPVGSVALPMLFVLLGGIPLIGGRTLIHRHLLRSRWWDTGVSLAGPAMNLFIALVIGLAFRVGLIPLDSAWGWGLAYLAVLQAGCALFNLIPMPPLDGFGAVAPHLSEETQSRAYSFGNVGFFLLIVIMWQVPEVGGRLWDEAFRFSDAVGVPFLPAAFGEFLARFR